MKSLTNLVSNRINNKLTGKHVATWENCVWGYDSVSDNVPQVRTLSEKINFSLEINVSDNWNILGLLSQVLEDM